MSTSPQTTPQRILATLQGYRDAAALKTAIDLELFTRIAHGSDTTGKLAAELGVPPRGLGLLCDYLVAAGLLEKEHEQFKVTGDVGLYLDKKSRAYIGNSAQLLYSRQLMQGYERLTELVRSGPSKKDTVAHPEWFDFARGLTDPAAAVTAFADAVVFPPGQAVKILDVGAGDGAYGIALGVRYPNAIVVALDAPDVLQKAQANADASKLGTRYQNISGDPLTAPLGFEYDAVLIAGYLHQYDESQINSLLIRILYALKKTGQLLILDFLSGDASTGANSFAGFRLNMLVSAPRGDVYTVADVKSMLESTGFHEIEARPLPEACAMLVTARP